MIDLVPYPHPPLGGVGGNGGHRLEAGRSVSSTLSEAAPTRSALPLPLYAILVA